MNRRWVGFLLAVFVAYSLSAAEGATPKNVILLIGDGMGVSHITAGKYVKGSLALERFKTAGLLTTYSQNALVTDSAAAGTALATGFKTYNGAISVSPDRKSLKTILEYAEERGKDSGLVVSCSITHATPASFVAHVDDRSKETEIAGQIAASGADVLFGGGWGYFVPKTTEGSYRTDETNLLAKLATTMKVIQTPEEFVALGDERRVAGLFAQQHPSAAGERKPSLSQMAAKAIDILSRNRKGFFLMIEGSQIDWAAHENNKDRIIREVVDFDEAIGKAMDFAQRDGKTLVVVTADHETGGFAILEGSVENQTITKGGFVTGGHSAAMVPMFAYGPGSEVLGGIHDNTFVARTIIGYWGGKIEAGK
jgi:alkaline phosphatase